MDFLTTVFLIYSFIAFYFLFLFILVYIQNREKISWVPPFTKEREISIVIPCYNEESSIGKTIENLINNGYGGLKKIVVVDDQSRDKSFEIIKKYENKYPGLVVGVQTPKNTGNAAGAKNYGAKFVETELIGFTDADSFPEKGAIKYTIGFFDDPKVGAITSTVLVYNRNNLLEKLQAIEYIVIKFTRKLLEFVESIYVTPGPLAVYRREYFEKVGKFDEENMTEDIEITWRFLSAGYKVRMSVPSKVYSVAPSKFRDWYKQRIRWNMGGVQTMLKYKKRFFDGTMLGNFVLPFFIFSWALGVFGLAILAYRGIRTIIYRSLVTSYSVETQTALLNLRDIGLAPSILVYIGVILFTLSVAFALIALFSIKEKGFKRPGIFTFMVYEFFYLLAYPVILVDSAQRLIRGRKKW